MEYNTRGLSLDLATNTFSFDYKEKYTQQIFTQDDINILDKNGKKEPNWKFMFFEWMPNMLREIYYKNIKKIYNYPNLLFIKGLFYEYGYNNKKINYVKALSFYLQGAKMNNQYCLFKLFYIFKDDKNAEFEMKQNIDLAMYFLIKSSSYNETFLDLNKIDPIIKLMHIVYYKDKDLNRCRKLLEKMKYVNNDLGMLIDDTEYKYLYYFLKLNFCNRDYEFKDSLNNLEQLSKNNNHLEASYKLACLYYNPIHKDICAKDVNKSLEIFSQLFKMSYSKSYCSYYKICEELKLHDKFENILMLSKKLKNFSAQFYANYLSRDKDKIIENSTKIFKYFFRSFLYGNLISVVIAFEIITQIIIKNLPSNNNNFDTSLYLQIFYEFVENRKDDPILFKLLDYDILILFHQIYAYFYYKGIYVKKDVKKAISLLEATFAQKKSIKNYRKVLYYLGKAYRKIGDYDKSDYYLKHTFDIYILLKEFPYHHYIVGKIFLNGIKDVKKNIEYAHYFFSLGANYKENFFFINSFYSKKCLNYILENKDLQSFVNSNSMTKRVDINIDQFINEDNICIVCFTNFKQVIFVVCGHKTMCHICFEKMFSKSDFNVMKCPMCKQESNDYINTFDFELFKDKDNMSIIN